MHRLLRVAGATSTTVLAAIATMTTACAPPSVFHDGVDHFSVTAPQGWEQVDFKALDKMNLSPDGRVETRFRVVTGWVRHSTPPCVMFVGVAGESVVGKTIGASDVAHFLRPGAKVTSGRHRFTATERLPASAGAVGDLVVGFFVGKESMVAVAGVERDEGRTDADRVFREVVDSFKFDDGYDSVDSPDSAGSAAPHAK
jgi:hypothetical protein